MADGDENKDTSQGQHTQQVDDLYIRNLFDDSTLFTNDNSFQSLVQTMRNEDQNTTPAQFNMPTELQHLFDNDTDDVLSSQPQTGVFQPGQTTTDFIEMWKDNRQDLSLSSNGTSTTATTSTVTPASDTSIANTNNNNTHTQLSHQVQQQQQHNQVYGISKQQQSFLSQQSLLLQQRQLQLQQQNVSERQYPQQHLSAVHHSIPSPQRVATPPVQSSSTTGSMTLLDSITAQLPPERKGKFNQLFVQLQKNTITAEHFLSQAKYLLDERGYQMLENLKSQTPSTTATANHITNTSSSSSSSSSVDISQSSTSTSSTTTTTAATSITTADQRKRHISSSQIRQEDSQRSMPGLITPQTKRTKVEHMTGIPKGGLKTSNTHMAIATPPPLPSSSSTTSTTTVATPEFKQPAAPTTQGLQIPRSTTLSKQSTSTPNIATPTSVSTSSMTVPAPTLPTTSTSTVTSSSSSGATGGGDNRIDYDAITDVMGYAGVDLKEEVEHFMKDGGDGTSGLSVDGVDRSKSQDFMNGQLLQQMVNKLARPLAIRHVDPDVVAYLSLATQDRLRGLMEDMVKASKHRIERRSPFQRPPPTIKATDNTTEYPLYKILVKADPKQALLALEQLDRRQHSSSSPSSSMTSTRVSEQQDRKKAWILKSKPSGAISRTDINKNYFMEDTNEDDQDRKVTVVDAIFALEREGQGGKGSGQKTLLKMYNQWLQ
ncbi:transcription initiation factor TFIID component TAF4 family-domain-containing protein [Halteromyces radiatus]|uniref:transcription initiation factor TFIID component TAF4 family-domain-containing protein n=1 Tax=Halteromyces radiatus TaxID=101107 RepID=UPI00221F3EB7|nr:transcription initiation factor TFIID component TAF4 family-domain-containing protein [Halteromyces radiatus]KAI8093182.1 transcription initiation factor TFIID component TAF4 family-domain-containing protein [Halteromyces radiatus]